MPSRGLGIDIFVQVQAGPLLDSLKGKGVIGVSLKKGTGSVSVINGAKNKLYTLKDCEAKYQIYVDGDVFVNGAVRYVVFWYDMNSHTNIGSYKSLNTAFEEGILAYERMTNKGK